MKNLIAAILISLVWVPTVYADDLLSILGEEEETVKPGELNSRGQLIREVLPTRTAEQNIFSQFFEKGDYEKALFQWPIAFSGTAFDMSDHGRALYGFLLFRNGLEVVGLERIMTVESPSKLNAKLVDMIKAIAPETHKSWTLVQSMWNPEWTAHLGVATEIRVRARNLYNPEQTKEIEELIKKTSLSSWERAWVEWQLVLSLSLQGKVGKAAKVLAHLMKAENNPISKDLMTLTAARLLYQNGYLDAAIKYYKEVPKTSDYWFDVQEEISWAYVRKGQPQNTLATLKTLMIPEFKPLVGPESLFLNSLAQLKVCDYPGVAKTLSEYRTRFRPKARNLQGLVESADKPSVQGFIARMMEQRVTLIELGPEAIKLPRYVTRDEVLAHQIQVQQRLEAEAKTAGDLYARSLTGGTGQVGFQASIEKFRKSVEQRATQSRNATLSRIQMLAKQELTEIQRILDKLHIVEAELIQQISMAERVIAASSKKQDVKKGSTGSKSPDALSFPFEGEIWFDEISNFKVDIKKGCQAKAAAR